MWGPVPIPMLPCLAMLVGVVLVVVTSSHGASSFNDVLAVSAGTNGCASELVRVVVLIVHWLSVGGPCQSQLMVVPVVKLQ